MGDTFFNQSFCGEGIMIDHLILGSNILKHTSQPDDTQGEKEHPNANRKSGQNMRNGRGFPLLWQALMRKYCFKHGYLLATHRLRDLRPEGETLCAQLFISA